MDRRATRRQPKTQCTNCGKPTNVHQSVPAWGIIIQKYYHQDDNTPANEKCER